MGGRKFTEQERIDRINEMGSNPPKGGPQFEYVSEVPGSDPKRFMVRNIENGELKESTFGHLSVGKNPWGNFGGQKKHTLEQIKEQINELGLKSIPNFEFVEELEPKMRIDKSQTDRIVRVQRIDNEDQKDVTLSNLKNNHNPWGHGLRTEEEIEIIVNEIGQYCDNVYTFFRYLGYDNGEHLVEIEELNSKKRTIRKFNELRRGRNPFYK